jgi:hypothetical protein
MTLQTLLFRLCCWAFRPWVLPWLVRSGLTPGCMSGVWHVERSACVSEVAIFLKNDKQRMEKDRLIPRRLHLILLKQIRLLHLGPISVMKNLNSSMIFSRVRKVFLLNDFQGSPCWSKLTVAVLIPLPKGSGKLIFGDGPIVLMQSWDSKKAASSDISLGKRKKST